MWWRWVFQFQFPHTCTTRIFRKIIFYKVSERLKRIIRTFTGFIAQDAQWEMRALFDVILEVCGIVRLYFPYKCSTKSSFMWFGKQWMYLFKIWTSLTEGCFQFHMLTRAVFVSTARACGCTWLCESSLMYLRLKMVLWCKINVNSQLRLKGLNGQDKPHYFLYFKRETCVNAV